MLFNVKLENTLKQREKFLDVNGELLKQKIKSLAVEFDEDLISLLIQDNEIKEHFFKEIKGATFFNYRKFIDYIDDKNFLLDSYTKFSNKIGLTISNKHMKQIDNVVLSFPFKDCILEGGQSKEEEKRKEIFFNEVLAKDEINRLLDNKVITNATNYYYEDGEVKETTDFKFTRDKDINKKRGHSEDTITDNLIIKGNNLLALHTIESNFAEKIKLIYIDPPYNTGTDSFGYNDNFNHSTWLVFMKNRINTAKKLLQDDGILVLQCDYNQDAYLRVLVDEIDELTFVANIAVKSSTPSGTKTAHKDIKIIKQKDTILVYKKNKIKLNPQYVPRENWDKHYSKYLEKNGNNYELKNLIDVMQENDLNYNNLENINPTNEKVRKFIEIHADNIVRLQSHKNKEIEELSRTKYKDTIYEHFENTTSKGLFFNGQVITPIRQGLKKVLFGKQIKYYWSTLLCDFWDDIDFQNTQNEGGVSLPNGKKPEALLKRIIELCTNEYDIVLDYHLGSGTTCAVSHKLNRQYIGIEQLDYGKNDSVVRLKKVIEGEQSGISKPTNWNGGGSFIFFELDKFNQKFIDDLKEATKVNILDIYFQICEKGFLNYDVDLKQINDNIEEFKSFTLDKQKEFLISILNKNMLYKNLSEIDDKTYEVDDNIKKLNKDFYNIKDKD